MKITHSTDIVIIGAGVLGLSLAFHLRQRGLRTLVLERELTVGVHASGKNAGMLRHLYRHPQLTEWANASISLLPESLRNHAFRQTGSLIIGRDIPNHHQQLFTTRAHKIRQHNRVVEVPAVVTAADGLFDSQAYMRGLFELCASDNNFLFGETVEHVERVANSIEVVTSSGLRIHTGIVVNAAGAWINRFLFGASVPVQCFARHLFVVDGFAPDDMPASDVGYVWEEGAEWYVRRWQRQSRLISLCDKIAADPDTYPPSVDKTPEVIGTALLFSKSSHLNIAKAWHCFRTYADDQLPIWGPDPRMPGLFWLAAFGGFGMSTAFAAAYDAARLISGELVTIESEFLPNRLIDVPAAHNENA